MSAPHLIVVAYFLTPGPGGPDAILNARLLRALAEHWPAGVSVISGGGPPDSGDECLSKRPGWTFHVGSGSMWGLRNRQSWRYRCVNRAVFELTGEGLKGQTWMRYATRALEAELDAHPGAIVYSRSLPNMSIEAVRRVRQKRSFQWVVNINDPLPPDLWPGQYPFGAKSCKAIRRTLKSVIRQADGLTFPCAQLRALEAKEFDGFNQIPTAILPHLPGRFLPPSNGHRKTAARMNIAYAGTMSRRRCRPEFVPPLMEFARRQPALADRLHFSFYLNQPNPFALEFIKSLPFDTSISIGLSAEECDEALLSADVLLDLASDVDTPLMMTKIATYVGLNRPVWTVGNPGGTSWNLVQRGWGYASDIHSAESIGAALRQILADWEAGVLESRCPPAIVRERFAPKRHIGDLRTLCAHIAAGPSRTPDLPASLRTDWP